MKKDILIMCQYFYPEYVSSAVLPTELAVDLVSNGWSVDVLAGYPYEYVVMDHICKKEKYKGVNIKRLRYLGLDKHRVSGRLLSYITLMLAYIMRIPLMFRYRCIIVYSNPPVLPVIPTIISKLYDTRLIFVAFDVYPDAAIVHGAISEDSFMAKLMRKINRTVYGQAKKVVALGSEMKNYLVRNQFTSDPNRIVVIPNWFSGEELVGHIVKNREFKDLRKKWPFIVLYSGNMGSLQDIDTILESMLFFKNRDDILFIFSGHGNKKAFVEDFVTSNNIKNAIIYGFLLGTDYLDMLTIADLCLVSLSLGIEGLGVPSKTYGYLAAGKPIAAIMSSQTDIVIQISKYSAGVHINPGDIQELVKRLSVYMSDTELLKTHGGNARTLFERFYTRQRCTDMYNDMINELIQH